MIQIRCSGLGKLMTSPRSKGEVLSETAKTFIEDLFREREFGIYKDISSRYTDKGIQMEDEAIQLAGNVLGWDLNTFKNEERLKNEWITGIPDINTETLLADIKCSWSGSTFPFFEEELPNKDYYWQLQGYMMLTGHLQAELVYCLMNTPQQIVEDEVRRTHWKLNLIDENLDVRDAIQNQHNYDHIPDTLRIKRFIVEGDIMAENKIREKVEQANEYYESLKKVNL
ncbi:hypothetical protein UFOVP211_25 [uncultured Caudovirales phage]|uniref:Uncharacterized protein n=1 Tax=uncultured Caudovirales phage TaxID=2100421 RepID=A0A6J7WT92_9CAUD|nr:hypothetical protein UFOVP211_25 [uncultured Caudovirales phage]